MFIVTEIMSVHQSTCIQFFSPSRNESIEAWTYTIQEKGSELCVVLKVT